MTTKPEQQPDPPVTHLARSSTLLEVDARTALLAAAMFGGFGLGGGGLSYVTSSMPTEVKAQIGQVPEAVRLAGEARAAGIGAATSADKAATATAELGKQISSMQNALTKIEERAAFNDRERERLERQVSDHDSRIRAIEAAVTRLTSTR